MQTEVPAKIPKNGSRLPSVACSPKAIVDWAGLIFAVLLIVLSTVISRPFEHYPLNDEWAYGYPLQSLLSAGKLVFPSTTTLALTPIAVALPFCMIFGFSYGLLRLLVAGAAILATAALFVLLRDLGLKRNQAGILSLAFAANPFVLSLANSFMTDVPSLAFNSLLFLFFLRAVKTDDSKYWALSAIALSCSVACRQTALLFLPAIFIVMLFRFLTKRRVFFPSLVFFVLPIATYLIAGSIVKACSLFPDPATSYQSGLLFAVSQALRHPLLTLWGLWKGLAIVACYLGLFCLPALVPCVISLQSRKNVRPALFGSFVAFAAVGVPLLAVVYFQGGLMPFSPNLFSQPYLGAYCLVGQMPVKVPEFWGKGFTLLTSVAAFAFASTLVLGGLIQWKKIQNRCATSLRPQSELNVPSSKGDYKTQFSIFNLVSLLVVFSFVLLQTSVHNLDRYYLLVLPNCICLISAVWMGCRQKFCYPLGLAIGLLVGAFGIMECLDYHNFARTREKVITTLLGRGIESRNIDGGPEFNLVSNIELLSFYKFDPKKPHEAGYVSDSRGDLETRNMRWWPVTKETHVVSLQELPGYNIEYAANYLSPIAGKRITIYALTKKTPTLSTNSQVE